MNFLVLLLICSFSSTFWRLVQSAKKHEENALDSCPKYNRNDFANSSLPIFKKLTPDIFLHVFEYLDNPNFDLLCVCRLFNFIVINNWRPNQMKLFHSLNSNPILKRIESDAEIYHLLKISPMILNEFFDYFVYSENCFNLMHYFINRYNNLKMTSNSFNQVIFEYWINGVISSNADTEDKIVEWFCSKINVNLGSVSYLINNSFTLIDRNHQIYEEIRLIVKALLRSCNYGIYETSPLFKSHLSAEDIEYLLEDYHRTNSVILDNIQRMALKLEMDYTAEEKLFFRLRNYNLLSNLIEIEERKKSNAEILTTIRYSMFSDNDAIIEKCFTGKSEGFALDDDLTESFAIAAIHAKNIDLFLEIYHLRNSKKFSVEFWELIARSKNLIKFIPDHVLLNFLEGPESRIFGHFSYYSNFFKWALRFEFLARKSVEERLTMNLKSLFINDELGILFALALYYPMDDFMECLGRNTTYIYSIHEILFSQNYIKYRNNVNEPLRIIYETLKLICFYDTEIRSSIKELFKKWKFIEKCIEPKNSTIMADFISRIGDEEISIDFAMLTNSKFRRNITGPLVAELTKNSTFGSLMMSIPNLKIAKNIILICDALGLQIGDFNFDNRPNCVNLDHLFQKLNQLKGTNLDKFLVERALYEFQWAIPRNSYKRNPMQLNSFPIFQLWWERNPESFKKFAPVELVQDFMVRLEFI